MVDGVSPMLRTIAILLAVVLADAVSAQRILPKPSPFAPDSIVSQWNYECPNSTLGSGCKFDFAKTSGQTTEALLSCTNCLQAAVYLLKVPDVNGQLVRAYAA